MKEVGKGHIKCVRVKCQRTDYSLLFDFGKCSTCLKRSWDRLLGMVSYLQSQNVKLLVSSELHSANHTTTHKIKFTVSALE
jgi:hypothetical protein